MLIVNAASLVILYAMQRLQKFLPLNPNGFGAVSADSSWNTAVSFTTNTNWQGYSGESTMSHFTQMAGLALHNFLSAATGIAIAVAVIRGVAREKSKGIGNFWSDCTRAILWVLLPFSFLAALFFVSRGVVQNFQADVAVKTLEGADQKIPQGPVASQEAIKELGTNGGGFFNANSAHPYENPTPGTNFLQLVLIFAIGAGLTNTLGRMTGSVRHGWAVFAAMALLFLVGVTIAGICRAARQPDSPGGRRRGRAEGRRHGRQHGRQGGPVRDRRLRALRHRSRRTPPAAPSTRCTTPSRPIGGLVPLANIASGEIIFGGVGAGLYGMFLFIVLSVFIAGLMVGRTPEYLGKKIESHEVKLAMLSVLILTLCILGFTAAAVGPAGRPRGTRQHGPPRLLRDSLRLHFGRRQQRLGLRRDSARTRSSTTRRSASTCSSAASSC